jgi:hypothetical protein
MRLKNYSNIPNERIIEMILFVRPSGISNFEVRISNCVKGYRGKSYSKGSAYHSTANPFIIARIPKTESMFPHYETHSKPGYINTLVLSREEALVHLIAHELRHLWQSKHKGHRVWGSKGKFSERDADAYAIKMTRKWRRDQYVKEHNQTNLIEERISK